MDPPQPKIWMQSNAAARRVERKNNKEQRPTVTPTAAEMRTQAVTQVRLAGGNATNELWILSQTRIYFGQYRGETFQWLLENCGGYVAHIVASHMVCIQKARSVLFNVLGKTKQFNYMFLYLYDVVFVVLQFLFIRSHI